MTTRLPTRRRRYHAVLLLLALPAALGTQATAQAPDPPPLLALDTGSVVRVQTGGSARWRVGRLRRVAGDTIWIASLAATRDCRPTPLVAHPGESRVEVSPDFDAVGRQRHRVIAVGALGGMLYGLAMSDDYFPRRISAVVGGLMGLTVGTLAAEVSRPRRWIRVGR
jgi:hypothetical protein